ncbi:MAG: hypothetical protein QOC92_3623 [Acidimicrobiaceae bacterium]
MRAQELDSGTHGVETGQLVPLYALIVAIAVGVMLLLAHLGVLAVHRAHARTAADAAALAGAAEGPAAAEEVALANGSVLESFTAMGSDVEVRVRVGSTHATARARREGGCRSTAQAHPVHFQPCQPTSPG